MDGEDGPNAMKPKVLFLPSWYPNDDNPVGGIFFQRQVKALSKEADIVVLVCHVVWWRHVLMGKLGPLPGVEEREGLMVYRERGFMPLPRAAHRYSEAYAATAERGYRRVISTWGQPDLIHAQVVFPSGLAAARIAKKHGIPVVLSEITWPFSKHLGTANKRRLVTEALRGADHLIPITPAMKTDIDAFLRHANSTVIGPMVETDFFVPREDSGRRHPEEKFRFLCIALLTEGKGVEYLLAAARVIIEQGMPHFELIIGGDGSDRERLEGLAQSMGLAGHCRFIGLLAPHEVRTWMQWCDVFVLPSMSESFGIVLGEAMACGKPVISTHCGGPDFVVTPETGLLVDVGSAEELAKAMRRFIEGSVEFDSRKIRESVVERFGEQAFIDSILEVYRQVLDSR